MKYIAVLDTNDFEDFEFFEDGNGKYLHAIDAGAINGEWIYLPFKPLEQESQIRPKGHWIDIGELEPWYRCSECDEKVFGKYRHYCPNCGADMRGEK